MINTTAVAHTAAWTDNERPGPKEVASVGRGDGGGVAMLWCSAGGAALAAAWPMLWRGAGGDRTEGRAGLAPDELAARAEDGHDGGGERRPGLTTNGQDPRHVSKAVRRWRWGIVVR